MRTNSIDMQQLRALSTEVEQLVSAGAFDRAAFERIERAALEATAGAAPHRQGDALGFLYRAAQPEWIAPELAVPV